MPAVHTSAAFARGRAAGLPDGLPAYWLRDNCRCAQCRHPGNGQKLYTITDLPADLAVRDHRTTLDGTLEVTWSDGHRSSYSADMLAARSLAPEARVARAAAAAPVTWDASLTPARVSWAALTGDTDAELQWLERFHRDGVGLVTGVPLTDGMVATVGDRLGHVRVTNYGRWFDVRSVPQPGNLADTALALGVHSDNPYRDPSPGIQLLHCLRSDAPGGDTVLVDGFRGAELMAAEDPDGFALLCDVPMQFRYANATTELRAAQTLITVRGGPVTGGAVTSVHVNNRSADWLDADPAVAEAWYLAYRRFVGILARPELEVVVHLEPGDCVVMRNDRTLHGRTAFDPNLGARHLQGCYIDRDGPDSRRLVLRRGAPMLQAVHGAFARRGHETYGEGVDMTAHAVQCAAWAAGDGATPHLVAAALLHDIGHLVHDLPADIADHGVDTAHEVLGATWLARYFGPAVTEPVRLHVAAKRYLAATESGYLARLSPASIQSLDLQGGPMTPTEAESFRSEPYFHDALRLRRWDEAGKVPGADALTVADFDANLSAAARAGS